METIIPIEIQFNKKKIIALLFGALGFVAIGLWFIVSPPQVNSGFLRDPTLILIVGIVSIIFFGLYFLVAIKKLIDKKPGLVINEKGIIDNASGVSAGYIPWSDIVEIKTAQVYNQRFLMILVQNPYDYINRQKNMFKRKAMEANFKSYGSPISLSSNTLNCNFVELKSILETQLNSNQHQAH